MKASIEGTSRSVGRKLGLVASILALFGGLNGMAANYLIVHETYDPPTLATPGGWEYGTVTDLSRQYVSEGVGGSTAIQVSATLTDQDCGVATCLFQSGAVGGNEWATRENTVLSFDLKIDQPGMLSVDVFLDALAEYCWNYGDFAGGELTSSIATIPLGAYQPGVFKRIVLPLNDPRWVQDPWPDPNNMAPLFEPNARTYNNVTLTVTGGSFGSFPASFTVTVDNVQICTRNAMVPFHAAAAGTLALSAIPDWVVTMQGTGAHMGFFDLAASAPLEWAPGVFELTTANGDKLLGNIHPAPDNLMGFEVMEGTGRFEGVTGSLQGTIIYGDPIDPTTYPFNMTLMGGLSAVGANK
jgi:hypothetical protein